MNQEMVRKCPDCGAPEYQEEYILSKGTKNETKISVWVPSCDCAENKMKSDEIEKENRRHRSACMKLLKASNMPDRCIKIEDKYTYDPIYDIPTESIKKEDQAGNPIILLEYAKIHEYIDNIDSCLKEGRSIFFPGNPGTRKTSYACEIGKAIIRRERSVKYYQVAEIITNKINIYELLNYDCLILDDLGMANIEKKDNLIFILMNKRLERGKITIIITNFNEDSNKTIFGDAFMDRLNLFLRIAMIGESSREYQDSITTKS